MVRWLAIVGMACCGQGAVTAVPPPPKLDPATALSGGSNEALASQLRGFVLEFLPDPLYEDAKKWGMQKPGPRGKPKNDGRWLRYRITGRHLPQTLRLRIDQVKKEATRTTFQILINFDATVLLDRQRWAMGTRLYSGSTRARFQVHLLMNCELTSRIEKTRGWLPDMIFRLRVTDSLFKHDHVVVEHTAGVGGDAARLLGDLMLGIVKAARPNLERDLARKVNAAIVKAGDTKEVRINLAYLLAGKKPTLPSRSK
jgi:hypothetical protein